MTDEAGEADEALMRAVRGGDLAKLGVLFERHHALLFDFLCRTTGARAIAEDLVQEVFVRILKYRATFRNEGSFEAWVYRIARNARVDYFRKYRAEEQMEDEHLESPAMAVPPRDDLDLDRETALLQRALMALRDDKRELIVLVRYREMKYEQIADLLGIEIGTVKVRIHRAMKELREIFLRLSSENAPCDVKTSKQSLQST